MNYKCINIHKLCLSFIFINYTLSQKFLFSVIISIYNTGRYLNDSIESILKQTLNPKKIQIILVNDGSTDKTEEICLSYKKTFHQNIIYIKQEHGGVSKGRNIGMRFAKGKYINFLDADDKWENKAFQYVNIFFQFYQNINIVGCRLIFFEGKESYHPLDYKFYKTRVVNLTEEYNCILLSSASSFFRYSLIKDKTFKEGIFNGEDTRFINSLLLLNPFLGIIKEAIYYYRKRADSTSAVQNSEKNSNYYFSIMTLVNEYLIKKSKKLYNIILPFIQFYLAYNMLFRISFPTYNYLEKERLNKYYNYFATMLNQIEDKYIIEQRILSLKEKIFALSKKYKRDIRNDIIIQNKSFIYSKQQIINITKYRNILIWRILDIKENKLHFEGKDNCFLNANNFFYFCKLENKIYYPKYMDYSGYDFITMYGKVEKGRIVIFDIPLDKKECQIIQFFISYNGYEFEIFPSLGWFSHIPSILNGYYNSGEFLLKYIDNRLYIYLFDLKLKESFEEKYQKQLKKIGKRNMINLRNIYFKYKFHFSKLKKKIWIINDRKDKAGDNGEYFFRFLKKINPKDINFFFVIKKDCSDFKRLRQFGNILEIDSEDYLNKFLLADKIISSVFESWVENPFGNERKYIKDLYNYDFIFIQHGIIKDDLSIYINRHNKNFNLIITSSIKEYRSIFKYNYYYNTNNIILTGLPRYDNLYNLSKMYEKENIILIIPSWRNYINDAYDLNTHESIYSQSFSSTNYFKFYNSLINDNRLITKMKKYNYTGILCLHPNFSKQCIDFKQNEIFSVLGNCYYQNIYVLYNIAYSNIYLI